MTQPRIASTAMIDPNAQLSDDVEVGHFCVVGPNVKLGPGCRLTNNVTIVGNTTIGGNNRFFQNSVIGEVPQDLKFKGGDTKLIIGDNNVFRENTTVHIGTELGVAETRIGSGSLFMAGVHIAHDCIVGDHVVIANNALIAGHVKLESSTVIGGGAGIHHFVTVGRNAMVGGLTRVAVDVPPFMIFEGNPGSVRGVNAIGMKRNGFAEPQIDEVKQAFRRLYRNSTFGPVLAELDEACGDEDPMRYLIDSLKRAKEGCHGRYLETQRHDKPEDIGNFYKNQKQH